MKVDTYQVEPALPERLRGLRKLAYNLLWSWDEELRVVFTRLDQELWDTTYQNPVVMLGTISQERIEEVARDDGFVRFFERAYERYQSYLKEPTWWEKRHDRKPLVAYFSAEFGLAECLPIYSGGLGVLSGHHLKSASDLGVPLVGVGLLYQEGYFHQYLTHDGWQQESNPVNDFYNLPVQTVPGPDGESLRVELDLVGQPLLIQVWRALVGRVPLYLLDTNIPENPRELQDITDRLYGGDQQTRIRQEMVLGIGGMKALRAVGLDPAVCHMNEGHSAFLSLERIRMLMRGGELSFHEALEAARAGNVFTTHTPVPAGFDVFPADLMESHFAGYREEVGLTREELLALGQSQPDPGGAFNMAGLALRTSAFVNGVSQLHGQTSRALFREYAPGFPEQEIPVRHVTNGAHTRSCVSREMATLFDRYLGPDWWRRPGQPETWQGVDSIPDEELWATHERRRARLVAFARKRVMHQLRQRGASLGDVKRARGVLDTEALTIGFARRFAPYKRATLFLKDRKRLKKILLDPDRPVQILVAGKAHPRDHHGKELLKEIVAFSQDEDVRRHMVFLEDYDLAVARYLVQGVDIWLNTPRRGMEASGTSGMKVVPNGGLHLSTLDGWWAEADSDEAGWSIGKGEDYADHAYGEYVESNALYDILEKDIVPLFYQRGHDDLPRGWIARMKNSMRKFSPAFSANRMIWEYAERFYLPAAEHYERLSAEGLERARGLAAWKRKTSRAWGEVRVDSVEAKRNSVHRVGESFEVRAKVFLGSVDPTGVGVELDHGPLDAHREIAKANTVEMNLDSTEETASGTHLYVGRVPCDRSGLQGYTVRVVPSHPDSNNIFCTGLITWH